MPDNTYVELTIGGNMRRPESLLNEVNPHKLVLRGFYFKRGVSSELSVEKKDGFLSAFIIFTLHEDVVTRVKFDLDLQLPPRLFEGRVVSLSQLMLDPDKQTRTAILTILISALKKVTLVIKQDNVTAEADFGEIFGQSKGKINTEDFIPLIG